MVLNPNNNIVFIGFMGVGKGTVARALAPKINRFYLDSDDLIESMQNRKIKEIFATDGEAYFRNLEALTATWLENNVRNALIATGGGFFKVPNLTNIGTVVYLQSSFEGILKRLHEDENAQMHLEKRPLLSDLKRAQELFDERRFVYEAKADIIVNVENRCLKEIVTDLEKRFNTSSDLG